MAARPPPLCKIAGVGMQSRGEGTLFNAHGNFATWNNFVLDGGDNNSFSTNLQERTPQENQPPVDPPEEVRLDHPGVDHATIVVTSPSGIIFYEEGPDYTLSRDAGGFTRITRVFTGRIPPSLRRRRVR